jgi:hypothetical protein
MMTIFTLVLATEQSEPGQNSYSVFLSSRFSVRGNESLSDLLQLLLLKWVNANHHSKSVCSSTSRTCVCPSVLFSSVNYM